MLSKLIEEEKVEMIDFRNKKYYKLKGGKND